MALLSTDMVCFKRTPDGDLKFPLEAASGLEAAAIGARTRVQLCEGEWFLNLDAGIPYLPNEGVPKSRAILGQKFDPVKVRRAFLQELLTVPGALDVPVLRVAFDSSTRVLSVTWVLRTTFGDTAQDTLARQV